MCKRNEVKFYYQRYEKSDENQGKLRKMGLYKTFREILQEEKIIYQIRNVYNKEYPNSPVPNEVFKTKEYYNFMEDKWETEKLEVSKSIMIESKLSMINRTWGSNLKVMMEC
jgi:hypothetical protein